MSKASVQRQRRDIRIMNADGVCWSIMTGAGEWQFVLFALALGLSEVVSGLVATIPVLAGAILQLLTPWGVRHVGSIRHWVTGCAAVQAVSLLGLSAAAIVGAIPVWALYATIAVYWASGYMTAPPWQTWVTFLVSERLLPRFWVNRSRWIQGGLGVGLCAGLILQGGEAIGRPLLAFGVVFAIAFAARSASSVLLSRQSDPDEELVSNIETPSFRRITSHFDHHTRTLLLYMLIFFLGVFIVAPFFGPYLREQLGFEYWQIMAITVITFVSKVLFLPFVGRMTEQYGPRHVLWIGAFVTGPAALFWAISDSFYWLLALQLYVGFGWACWETGSFLLVFDVIPAVKRTPVMTLYQLALAIMMVVGSLVGASLLEGIGVDRSGYVAIFAASSAVRILAMAVLRLSRGTTGSRGDLAQVQEPQRAP